MAVIDGSESTSAHVKPGVGGRGRRLRLPESPSTPRLTENEQRLAFLADVSAALASSLDFETTLQSVARLAVPALADWCIVHLLHDDGSVHYLAVVFGDPSRAELARELERRYPPSRDGNYGVSRVLRTGKPEFYPHISNEERIARARDPEHLRLLQGLASTSSMIVPMVARGRTLGAVSFISTRPDEHYTPAALVLAEDVGRRAALAVDNARLYKEAQHAIRMREEFVASVTHDLKNPLTVIKGLTQLLDQQTSRPDPPPPEWFRERLERIGNSTSKMSTLIDELLDAAHLQAGQPLELDLAPTDLVKLADRAVTVHQQAARHQTIVLETDIKELVGRWDHDRLERVIDNLLSNAVKYSRESGRITVSVKRVVDDEGTWALLSVHDEGIGIPAADLPHVFKRFHRGENVVGRISGTGIGLSGARQIVEQHGGTIEVESEEGIGSTFTVRLPVRGSNTPRRSRRQREG